jgi:hypothetical protein
VVFVVLGHRIGVKNSSSSIIAFSLSPDAEVPGSKFQNPMKTVRFQIPGIVQLPVLNSGKTRQALKRTSGGERPWSFERSEGERAEDIS